MPRDKKYSKKRGRTRQKEVIAIKELESNPDLKAILDASENAVQNEVLRIEERFVSQKPEDVQALRDHLQQHKRVVDVFTAWIEDMKPTNDATK